MTEASVDAIVCDPPYGLEFMGKDWDKLGATAAPFEEQMTEDGQVDYHGKGNAPFGGGGQRVRYGSSAASMQGWHESWAREALRVLKPGGHLLAFGGTRTYHRLACAVEDAGFEVRDCILYWGFGSGFPKSLNVSKAIDKIEGVEGGWRKEDHPGRAGVRKRENSTSNFGQTDYGEEGNERHVYEAASEKAKRWQGWGTALKPAYEPIVVARKPLTGTVAANVLEHGTGAINVDGCRLGTDDQHKAKCESASGNPSNATGNVYGEYASPRGNSWTPEGRWPANVVLSHTPLCEPVGTRIVKGDPRETGDGERPSGFADVGAESGDGEPNAPVYGDEEVIEWDCAPNCPVAALDAQSGKLTSDSGGASRFFATFQADKLCVLCGLPCAESAAIHSSQSVPPSATVPAPAPAEPQLASEGIESESVSPARSAESSSRTTEPTDTESTSTAPCDAADSPSEPSAPSARSVGNPCQTCETAIAQSVARWQQGQTPESAVGALSMPAPRKQILSQSLALIAVDPASIDTTTITRNLSKLLGSVVAATTGGTPANATGDEFAPSDQFSLRAKYVAKTSRAERNAGLEGFEGPCQCDKTVPSHDLDRREATRADAATLPPRATTEPSLTDDSDSCTTSSGRKPTDRSPTVSKSTTGTRTSRTIASRISNSSRPLNTSASTPSTTDEPSTEAGSGTARSVEGGNPPPRSTSTSISEAGFSTADADPATSPELSRTSSSADSEPERCPDCGGVISGALRNSHPT
jgi:site-specific DNA-methyltransferase (adenine-specific)